MALFLTIVGHEFGIEAAELGLRAGTHERPPYRCLMCVCARARDMDSIQHILHFTAGPQEQSFIGMYTMIIIPFCLKIQHIMYVSVYH